MQHSQTAIAQWIQSQGIDPAKFQDQIKDIPSHLDKNFISLEYWMAEAQGWIASYLSERLETISYNIAIKERDLRNLESEQHRLEKKYKEITGENWGDCDE